MTSTKCILTTATIRKWTSSSAESVRKTHSIQRTSLQISTLFRRESWRNRARLEIWAFKETLSRLQAALPKSERKYFLLATRKLVWSPQVPGVKFKCLKVRPKKQSLIRRSPPSPSISSTSQATTTNNYIKFTSLRPTWPRPARRTQAFLSLSLQKRRKSTLNYSKTTSTVRLRTRFATSESRSKSRLKAFRTWMSKDSSSCWWPRPRETTESRTCTNPSSSHLDMGASHKWLIGGLPKVCRVTVKSNKPMGNDSRCRAAATTDLKLWLETSHKKSSRASS